MACHDDIGLQCQSGVDVEAALSGDIQQATSESYTIPLNDKDAK